MKFDNPRPLLYPLPIMRHVKRPPRGLVLALVALFAIAVVVLPAGCLTCEDSPSDGEYDQRIEGQGTPCFTPEAASVSVGDIQHVVVTIILDHTPRKLNEESGWKWQRYSVDGGEIEFSSDDLQWSAGSEGYYVAQVDCTAVKAGTAQVGITQPAGPTLLYLYPSAICPSPVCTITITTTPMMW